MVQIVNVCGPLLGREYIPEAVSRFIPNYDQELLDSPPGLVNTASIRTSTLRNWLKTQSSTRTSIRTTPCEHTNEHTQLYITITLLYVYYSIYKTTVAGDACLNKFFSLKDFYVRGNK